VDIDHLGERSYGAARHRGAAFVEIYQNCNVFNPDVFAYASDKAVKFDNVVYVEHGKPMIFGKDRDRGVRLNGLTLEVVSRSQVASSELLLHDETLAEPISGPPPGSMTYQPDDPTSMPEVMGVSCGRTAPHHDQVEAYQTGCDPSEVDLAAFYATGETWTYEENEPPGNQLP
jgi:2-oxoglutarate ferredoxin oxidoreductase subunit beta